MREKIRVETGARRGCDVGAVDYPKGHLTFLPRGFRGFAVVLPGCRADFPQRRAGRSLRRWWRHRAGGRGLRTGGRGQARLRDEFAHTRVRNNACSCLVTVLTLGQGSGDPPTGRRWIPQGTFVGSFSPVSRARDHHVRNREHCDLIRVPSLIAEVVVIAPFCEDRALDADANRSLFSVVW